MVDVRLFGDRIHRPVDSSIAGWHIRYPAAGYEDVSLCQLQIFADDSDKFVNNIDPKQICVDCRRYAKNMGHPQFSKSKKAGGR